MSKINHKVNVISKEDFLVPLSDIEISMSEHNYNLFYDLLLRDHGFVRAMEYADTNSMSRSNISHFINGKNLPKKKVDIIKPTKRRTYIREVDVHEENTIHVPSIKLSEDISNKTPINQQLEAGETIYQLASLLKKSNDLKSEGKVSPENYKIARQKINECVNDLLKDCMNSLK